MSFPVEKTKEKLVRMAEGNPGGLTVMMDLITQYPFKGADIIAQLDEMDIRGGMIWVGYKDHCKEDLPRFIKAVEDKNPEMLKVIEAERAAEAT